MQANAAPYLLDGRGTEVTLKKLQSQVGDKI